MTDASSSWWQTLPGSAPTGTLIGSVDAQSTKQAAIVFDVPETADSLVLLIDNGEDAARMPLVLEKSG